MTRSEEHTSELQSLRDLPSFPARRFSDLIGKMLGGIFQRAVKVLQALAEIVTSEHFGIERSDDFFNLLRDDVALHEISGGKNFADDALGKDVLDDHFLE